VLRRSEGDQREDQDRESGGQRRGMEAELWEVMRALLLCMHGGGREKPPGRGIIIQVKEKEHLVLFL
jgi:hypothetical protein